MLQYINYLKLKTKQGKLNKLYAGGFLGTLSVARLIEERAPCNWKIYNIKSISRFHNLARYNGFNLGVPMIDNCFQSRSFEFSTKATRRWWTFYINGNVISTLSPKVAHRPETILHCSLMSYKNVLVANLSCTILMNRFN